MVVKELDKVVIWSGTVKVWFGTEQIMQRYIKFMKIRQFDMKIVSGCWHDFSIFFDCEESMCGNDRICWRKLGIGA